MKKFYRIFPLLLTALLCGCSRPQQPGSKLVTGVYVQARQEQQLLERSYTDPEKMETVLCYLRALHTRRAADCDPERYRGRQFRIDLAYSDGTRRRIYQRCDRFLSEDLGPWQTVDRSKAVFLYPLIKSMPSD